MAMRQWIPAPRHGYYIDHKKWPRKRWTRVMLRGRRIDVFRGNSRRSRSDRQWKLVRESLVWLPGRLAIRASRTAKWW